ncbi:uncharacterized protein LOC124437625 isoform X1 [Xenia sp. Carnegie-2017]|uniref:uncharacterized protein LOC124437625 isoform X1 n=1 Tax=Xenia sp. Carnegie-2017 TaxID=2897299 RepID=UPI001F04144F|nr:uncharacterized protein LOC124437625 isoform X1 [Xenia sp. Carnegie-2017]XP_046843550.1 uncharacterized protein LOC124437625 isoform X1 [Xenia sp. Carnegie-2017]
MDHQRKTLVRANKEFGNKLTVLDSNLQPPLTIIAVFDHDNEVLSTCSKVKKCSNLCLSKPRGHTCASVCNGKLYLKDSCENQQLEDENTHRMATERCKLDELNCTISSMNLSKGVMNIKVFIATGVVTFLFIMALLCFLVLGYRYYMENNLNRKQKDLTPYSVTYAKTKE